MPRAASGLREPRPRPDLISGPAKFKATHSRDFAQVDDDEVFAALAMADIAGADGIN